MFVIYSLNGFKYLSNENAWQKLFNQNTIFTIKHYIVDFLNNHNEKQEERRSILINDEEELENER